jgi:rhodanese-related sulfurtransferase
MPESAFSKRLKLMSAFSWELSTTGKTTKANQRSSEPMMRVEKAVRPFNRPLHMAPVVTTNSSIGSAIWEQQALLANWREKWNGLSSQFQTVGPARDRESSNTEILRWRVPAAATVSLADFWTAVENKSALILDGRPAVFFERGYVSGALNLSRDEFACDYRRLAPTQKAAQTKPVIVYCSGGACHNSRLVANALLSLGFRDGSVYRGGWDEWSADHLAEAAGSAPWRS